MCSDMLLWQSAQQLHVPLRLDNWRCAVLVRGHGVAKWHASSSSKMSRQIDMQHQEVSSGMLSTYSVSCRACKSICVPRPINTAPDERDAERDARPMFTGQEVISDKRQCGPVLLCMDWWLPPQKTLTFSSRGMGT